MLLLLLLFLAFEALAAAGSRHGAHMPGAPRNISLDDAAVLHAVLDATVAFNNQSNDAFLFKPSAVRRAWAQVVKGLLYMVDFDISRTICRKPGNHNLKECDLQPPGPLQETFPCHADVWLIPWKRLKTLDFLCKPGDADK